MKGDFHVRFSGGLESEIPLAYPAVKVARPVLRGESGGNAADLLNNSFQEMK